MLSGLSVSNNNSERGQLPPFRHAQTTIQRSDPIRAVRRLIMATTTLSTQYPWTSTPLVINAPLGGFAFSDLASEVSKAGGLGFIGSTVNVGTQLNEELSKAREKLSLIKTADDMLPVGVGFLPFIAKLEEAVSAVKKHRPVAAWIFAAKTLEEYATWTKEIRAVSPSTKIWIPSGNVSAALQLAKTCNPDVLVMQGSDAGGHGYERNASVISLLPETIDTLKANGFSNIPVVAAGGIVDGRGVAAAIALGAQGAIMGTRFLAASETVVDPTYQQRILDTKDGAESTVRAKVFDELRGNNSWPSEIDGRAIVNESYEDFKNGAGLEDIRRRHTMATLGPEKGFSLEKGKNRAAIWAGSGIGLVTKIQPAGEIVKETRDQARKVLSEAAKI